MILFNPVTDFFLIASKHARDSMIRDLNFLEAEIMMAEETLIKLKRQDMSPEALNAFENKLDDLKKILANKKKEFYEPNSPVRMMGDPDPPRHMDNRPAPAKKSQ